MDFKQFYKTVQFDIDKEIRTVLQATQGDTKSRGLIVPVVVNSVVTPITTETMNFFALKPDGTRVMTAAVKDGDKFRIDFTNQTFSVAGTLLCALVLYGTNGEKIADKKFKMTVDSSLEDGAIISEDERGILDRAFELAEDIVPRMELLEDLSAQFSETNQRIDNLVTTPVPTGEIIAEEIIDARQGKSSLGANITEVKSQLADTAIVVNPKLLKEQTDKDDTESFRKMMLQAQQKGIRKLIVPFGTYTISKPVWFNGVSDFELDLSNSTILWNGTDEVMSHRNEYDIGVFSIHGTTSGIKTPITAWEKEVTRSINIIPHLNRTGNTLKCSKVTVGNATGYKKDDYIIFQIGDPNNSGNVDYTNVFKPTVSVMTRIIDIDGNDIYIDYYSPYDWSQVDIPALGFIEKIDPIKNTTIKNAFIKDITDFIPPEGTIGDNPDRLKLVSGIGLRYAANFTVENVRGLNMKLNLITGMYCYKGNISKIENKYPLSFGGGEGYGMQMIRAMKVHVEDFESNAGNSCLDFSGCSFSSAKRVITTNNVGSKTIGTHGMAEHDIIFEDCAGIFRFNNGTEYFAAMSKNIKLIRCKGALDSEINGFLEIDIVDSEITFKELRYNYFSEIHFTRGKVIFQPTAVLLGHERGLAKKSNITFDNTEIIGNKSDVGGVLFKFRNFRNLEISGGGIDIEHDNPKQIGLEDIENIKLDTNLRNTSFNLQYRNNVVDYAVLNIGNSCVTVDRTVPAIFYLDEISAVNLLINVGNNTVLHQIDSVTDFISLGGSPFLNKSNAKIVVNQTGNTFYTKYYNKLRCINQNLNEGTSSINMSGTGNRFINALQSGYWGGLDHSKGVVAPFDFGILGINPVDGRLRVSAGTVSVSDWKEVQMIKYGPTTSRPTSVSIGQEYFDTTIIKPIWYRGSYGWVDANGVPV